MINQLGIIKKGIHSYDEFGLIIKSKKISLPSKNKIELTVPFVNGTYDFSFLSGDQTYSDRTLEYVFSLTTDNPNAIEIYGNQVIHWLLDGGRAKLEDDEILNYYFMAECISANYSVISRNIWEITARFKAYPFRISEYYEGHDIWDIFNFEEDYAQQTAFTITNPTEITLYNPSAISITPTVICTGDMAIQMNDTTYKFVAGTTKDYRFKLAKGENHMVITGQGDIEFKFRKEVL